MRVCVIGAGLAGSLLTWRLADAGVGVDVIVGDRRDADATAASGGAVRGYEPHLRQRRLAVASLGELLASPTLREWANYRPGQCTYLRRDSDGLDLAVAEVDGAQVYDAAELTRAGWAGLEPTDVAVVEARAGRVDPDRLRTAILHDAASRPGVRLHDRALGVDDLPGEYDRVVVAAGSWTAAVLRASGLPADGYRVKSIQYAIYPATGWPPTAVVDDVTGMYGLPDTDGHVLLGLATDRWDVEPDRPPFDPAVQEEAVRLARARFPALRLGPTKRQVGSADCYAQEPMLMLRPALGNVVTFTGGAGGSVKTALAASRQAANELITASG